MSRYRLHDRGLVGRRSNGGGARPRRSNDRAGGRYRPRIECGPIQIRPSDGKTEERDALIATGTGTLLHWNHDILGFTELRTNR